MTRPNWDDEQLEVIKDHPSSWQLVVAGPGTGKSAVACQRIAHLIDEGISAARILMISFTRTAVTELRDRILSYCVAGEEAKRVRISTIDSHAWSLRAGFDDIAPAQTFGDDSYEMGIDRTIALLRSDRPELRDFLESLHHVIVDEAQDIVGIRATLVSELLARLSPSCGVTVLADPAQAIYGFTADDEENEQHSTALMDSLYAERPRHLKQRRLTKNHRVKNPELAQVFITARNEIERPESLVEHLDRVESTIRESCGQDIGQIRYERLADFLSAAGRSSMLVLFRSRAEVLIASSYCSEVGVEHRLRMSGLPTVVSPWIGWLLGEVTTPTISRADFDVLWAEKSVVASAPFQRVNKDAGWSLLHRFAAGARKGTIELAELRRHLARPRPPVELCEADVGYCGPILGTIHASKGREAETVMLFLPRFDANSGASDEMTREEGRVLYVGATRARELLVSTGCKAPQTTKLEFGRTIRRTGSKVQIEVGRLGDVDLLAHFGWSSNATVQRRLASLVGSSEVGRIAARRDADYAWRILIPQREGGDMEIAEMSSSFASDVKRVWSRVDTRSELRPKNMIPHVHVVGITTVGLTDEQAASVKPPYSQSGIGLAPVIKAFSTIQFERRRTQRT